MSVLRKAPATQIITESPLKFLLSDATPDRYGDVVEASGWDLKEFKTNPIALLNHDPDFPIGKWTDIRIEGGRLMGHLSLAPQGTSARIDEVRKLIFARVLCACSV